MIASFSGSASGRPRCVLRGLKVELRPSGHYPTKGAPDGPTPAYSAARLPGRGRDRAVLPRRRYAYVPLNPRAKSYESIKRLSDSEVLALTLLQQLRGVESERSFLRDAGRFFAHLFPGVVGLHPSSL